MRILVTGGAGYIGSHCLVELLGGGHDALVVDDFSNAAPEALQRVAEIAGREFETANASITDGATMTDLCKRFKPEAVIHLAGLKAVGESVARPLRYYETNVLGTVRLLEAMTESGCGRIVFSSSATVYGAPQYLPIDEAHPLAPVNPYGRSKYFIEQIINDWAACDSTRAAMHLRYFNPVGAHPSARIGEAPNGTPDNLAPFIAQVAAGIRDKLKVFGDGYDTPDGTGVRDYIHISDLAAGHLKALEYIAENTGTGAVNLGTGRGYSVLEVVAAFETATGKKIPYEVAPPRPGDVASCYAAPEKAKALLGWQAVKRIDEMCADCWHWQQKNPRGFES